MNNNEFYLLNLWLREHERNLAWLSRRLEIHRVTLSKWKKNNKIPHIGKLAISKVTGATMEQLWEEV